MTNRIIVTVVFLLVILGLVFWWQEKKTEPQKEAISYVSVYNQTSNQDAAQVSPGDTLVLNFTVENPNDEVLEGYVVEANILDVQEAANLLDAEGGHYNPATGSLLWTPLNIPAKGSITKKVKV